MTKKQEGKTVVQRFFDYFSNHRVFSIIVIAAALIGGLVSFGEAVSKAYTFAVYLFSSKEAQMTLVLRVENPGKLPITINPVCALSLTEVFGNVVSSYGDSPYHLKPRSPKSTGMPYVIPAGGSRDYQITVQDDNSYKLVFERGASVAGFTVWALDGRVAVNAKIPFNKDEIRTNKAVAVFR